MLLAMFALITFMLTFMSVLSNAFMAEAPALAAGQSAGWDLWVDSLPTSPVDARDIGQDPDVAATASLTSGSAQLSTEGDEPANPDDSFWPVTGIDEALLGPGMLDLSERLDRYPDDRAAYEAILADPTLAIAPDWLLEGDDGPDAEAGVHVGDNVSAVNPSSGSAQAFTIVGIIDEDWSDNGLLMSRDAATSLLGDQAVENRQLVEVNEGADAEAVADRLEARWITRGAEATTFLGMVQDEVRETQGFLRLLQGYIGLGLLIGVAGLGVVMVRAVRERRRQIGMLRALGFSARIVRRAFLSEAGFIAVQGIVLGMGLGLVTSYQMLRSDVFDEQLAFAVPWLALVVLFVVPAAGALFTAAAPATQAARIRPAAALRIAD
jgi:putative ABC transport system permease protein